MTWLRASCRKPVREEPDPACQGQAGSSRRSLQFAQKTLCHHGRASEAANVFEKLRGFGPVSGACELAHAVSQSFSRCRGSAQAFALITGHASRGVHCIRVCWKMAVRALCKCLQLSVGGKWAHLACLQLSPATAQLHLPASEMTAWDIQRSFRREFIELFHSQCFHFQGRLG